MSAFFHMRATAVSRSKGRSSVGYASYIAGEKLRDERLGRTFYPVNNNVGHTEILAPEGSPDWVYNRRQLWNTVEKVEKRKDAQVSRSIEFALPRSLDRKQRLGLVRDYINHNFVGRGMVADFAMHKQNEKNPHFHVQLTMRPLENGKFGNKERAWNHRAFYQNLRESWTSHVNHALYDAGVDESIDHRSYKDREMKQKATKHEGPKRRALERKGVKTDRRKENLDIESYNILAGHTKVKRREREEVSGIDPTGHPLTRGHDRGWPSR